MNTKKFSGSLTNFYLSYVNKLYENPLFRKQFLSHKKFPESTLSKRKLFEKNFIHCLEEAELTLNLIKGLNFTKKDALLEIGCAFGLVYGFLKKQHFNIHAIEPSDSSYNLGLQMFKIMDIDSSNFYPFTAKETVKICKQFDIIFSNNVLEHILDLERSLSSLKKVLKSKGFMIHNTVNYFIPYEPHYKIMLFPFFPKLTSFFKPSLKKLSSWNDLNFITTKKLKDICRSNNLTIEFEKDRLQKSFLRLDSDPEFAQRQRHFIPIYKILKLTGLVKVLDKIPAAFTTPITFTIRR